MGYDADVLRLYREIKITVDRQERLPDLLCTGDYHHIKHASNSGMPGFIWRRFGSLVGQEILIQMAVVKGCRTLGHRQQFEDSIKIQQDMELESSSKLRLLTKPQSSHDVFCDVEGTVCIELDWKLIILFPTP